MAGDGVGRAGALAPTHDDVETLTQGCVETLTHDGVVELASDGGEAPTHDGRTRWRATADAQFIVPAHYRLQ